MAVMIAGRSCTRTKDNVEIPDHITNLANPLFINTDTRETFLKYSTNVSNTTKEEINTLEFTSSYTLDDLGNT